MFIIVHWDSYKYQSLPSCSKITDGRWTRKPPELDNNYIGFEFLKTDFYFELWCNVGRSRVILWMKGITPDTINQALVITHYHAVVDDLTKAHEAYNALNEELEGTLKDLGGM